jgi:hypothetical protein
MDNTQKNQNLGSTHSRPRGAGMGMMRGGEKAKILRVQLKG